MQICSPLILCFMRGRSKPSGFSRFLYKRRNGMIFSGLLGRDVDLREDEERLK